MTDNKREEIAKEIKFDITNDLIVKGKDFIEADLSKVIGLIAQAERNARVEVAEKIKRIIDFTENGKWWKEECPHRTYKCPCEEIDCYVCLCDSIISANTTENKEQRNG